MTPVRQLAGYLLALSVGAYGMSCGSTASRSVDASSDRTTGGSGGFTGTGGRGTGGTGDNDAGASGAGGAASGTGGVGAIGGTAAIGSGGSGTGTGGAGGTGMGGTGGVGGSNGPSDLGPVQCRTIDDCPSVQQPPTAGRCLDTRPGGVCTGCDVRMACPAGTECRPDPTGPAGGMACVRTCLNDAGCNKGMHCFGGLCLQTACAFASCPAPYVCSASLVCARPRCDGGVACPSPLICNGGGLCVEP